jgi:hypothetical protein
LILAAAAAANVPAQTVDFLSQAPLGFNLAHQRIPVWNGGSIAVRPRDSSENPVLSFINRSGGEGPPIALVIPGASAVKVASVAQGPDGKSVVAGMAYDSSGKGGGFIAVVSADRSSMTTFQVFPYCPYSVRFAPDGTVWALGLEMINANPNAKAIDQGHSLIRQYDQSGKQLAGYIPRNSLPGIAPMALVDDIMAGGFATAQGRIGWYAAEASQYFEISSGALTAYPGVAGTGGSPATGMALTDSGATLISADQIYSLDRTSKKWVPLALPGGSAGSSPVIFGGSGNVVATNDKGTENILFFQVR